MAVSERPALPVGSTANPSPGRATRAGPRRADGTSGPTRPVAVRLTATELAAIDAARGEETRSDFIRRHALGAARDGAPVPGDGGAP